MIVRLSAVPAFGLVVAAAIQRLLIASGATVTERPAPLLWLPSLTTIDEAPAL